MRFSHTQARTNDPGQVSFSLIPSSNARWQFKSARFGRNQARTNDLGQVSFSLIPSSNARWQFTSVRFGHNQTWTNDPGQVSLYLIPSSNARWQFTSELVCLVIYKCRQPLDFPNVNILILPSGKGLQLVDSGCCDLDLRINLSPLPGHICSDTIDNVRFPSFLGSWLCCCLLQASCIASSHFTGYCSPYHRCNILNLRLYHHSILRHDFQALNN